MSRGSVIAVCGIRFAPRMIAFGRKALSGEPPDPSRSARGANPRRMPGDGHQVGLVRTGLVQHAIDERRCHPVGVFKAECGHLLMVVTTLHDGPTGSRARRAPRNSSSAR